MIGKKAGQGIHFYECLRYNAKKKNKAGERKAEWVEYRNLNSNDPTMAAHEMEMTADQRRANAKDPLFHYVISWDEQDNPTKEQMLEVADQWLQHMRLEGHQIQIASHVDTDKPHLHLAINRVHPQKKTTWDRWNYKTRSETLLKELEYEFDWKIVPGKLHPHLGIDIDSPAPKAWELHREKRINKQAAGVGGDPDSVDGRGILEKCEEIKDELYEVLDNKKGFQALDKVLDSKGLWLQAKGQGMVITDGEYNRKASDLDGRGQFSCPNLEKVFGESLEDYIHERDQAIQQGQGITLVAGWKEALDEKDRQVVEELFERKIPKMEESLQLIEEMNQAFEKEMATISDRIEQELALAYKNPQMASNRLQTFLKEQSPEHRFEKAEEVMWDNPERFGEIDNEQALGGIAIAFRDAEQARDEYGGVFSSINKEDRHSDIEQLRKTLAKRRHQLHMLKEKAKGKLQGQIAKSEAGKDLVNVYNKSLSIYRATNAIYTFFLKERLVGRNRYLDQAMGRALKEINDDMERVYENPQKVKQFFGEIAWNDYDNPEEGINYIQDLYKNPEKYGTVKDRGNVSNLHSSLRYPAVVREDYRDFLDELGDISVTNPETGKTTWEGQWFTVVEGQDLQVNFGRYADSEKPLGELAQDNKQFLKDIADQPLPEPVKEIIDMRAAGKPADEIFEKNSDFLKTQGAPKDVEEYFKRLPDAYSRKSKLVGGLTVAKELNRWVARAASATPAGNVLFTLGGSALKVSTNLARMIDKSSKSAREAIRAVIKDSVSITQANSLDQEHQRGRENDRDFSR
jgi:hypothetical protein